MLRISVLALALASALPACSPFLQDSGLSGGSGADGGGGQSSLPPPPLVDCHNPANEADLRCRALGAMVPGTVGAGPAIDYSNVPRQEVMGGAIDGDELFLAIQNYATSGDGGVLSVNLVTGERRLVSGSLRTLDGSFVYAGNGDGFQNLQNVVVAPGGPISAQLWDGFGFDGFMFEIDRATGNRTTLSVGGKCAQVLPESLLPDSSRHAAMAPDTTLFEFGVSTGDNAIVRLVGDQCDLLIPFQGGQTGSDPHALRYDRGLIWSANFVGSELSSVDVATGSVTLVSGPTSDPATSAIPMGRDDVAVGDQTVFTVGGESDFLVTEVNRANGARKAHKNDAGPVRVTPNTPQNVWLHPKYAALLLEIDGAIVVYDPATDNSNTLSY